MKVLIKMGGCLLIILGLIIQLYDMIKVQLINKIKEEYCYNLPLNTFYKDSECLKYKEILK